MINPSIQFNPDDSDSEKPDTAQVELVKKLHREMADRRIIVNMKTKLKLKKECVQKRTFKKSRNSRNLVHRKSFKPTQKLELRDMFFSSTNLIIDAKHSRDSMFTPFWARARPRHNSQIIIPLELTFA